MLAAKGVRAQGQGGEGDGGRLLGPSEAETARLGAAEALRSRQGRERRALSEGGEESGTCVLGALWLLV